MVWRIFLAAALLVVLLGVDAHALTVTTAAGSGADTFLSNDGQGGDYGPDSLHGTQEGFEVRTAWDVRMKIGYLRFDLSGISGDMSGATLGLYLTSGKRDRTLSIYGLSNESLDNWDEATISYNNAPGMIANPPTPLAQYAINADLTKVADLPVTTAVGLHESDVSALMDTFLANNTNDMATFVVIYETTSADTNPDWWFATKESVAANPTLMAPTLTLPNAIPEPVTLALLGLGSVVLLRRRK